MLSFGGHGSGNGQLNDPRGVAVTPAGNVWVADYGNDRVVEFGPNGQFLREMGVRPDEKLNEPVDVASDGDGGVWVAEDYPARLIHFSAQGQLSVRAGLVGAGTIESLTVVGGQRIITSQQADDAPNLVEYTPSGGSVIYTSSWWWPWGGVLTGVATNAAGHEAFAVNETRLRTCFKKRTRPLNEEPLRHMWSTLGGVGGAIAL